MFRKKVVPVLWLIILLAVPSFAQIVTIEGTLSNSSSLKTVYLFQFFGHEVQKFDSAILKNGEFRFTYNKPLPRGFYLFYLDKKYSFPLILGNESITINGDLANFTNSATLSGSVENMLHNQLNVSLQNINNSRQRIDNAQKEATAKNDFNSLARIKKEADSLDHALSQLYFEIAETHPETFVGKVSRFFSQPYNSNYFSKSDFSDQELLRGGMLPSKIVTYYQKHVPATVDAWLNAYEYLKSCSQPGTPGRELVYVSIAQLFKESVPDHAGKIVKEYALEFPGSSRARLLKESMPPSSPDVGDIASEIALNDHEGNIIKLSSLRGKVVLLDFWASWCGPCRAENPNVVRVYHLFKDKGFTVYGVSLDNDRNKWLDAVAKDGLAWSHVSDLKGWQSAGAALYKVNSIPATYLIGKDGRIIGKNLRGTALEQKLREIFNSEIN